jgi:thermopsin
VLLVSEYIIPYSKGDSVNIHYWYNSAPAPVGIVDYGIENEFGNEVPYAILADSVIGNAEIFSIGAHNENLTEDAYGASLQLNVVLQINTTSGQKDFWLQDMTDFTTNASSLYFTDNIWNESLPNANMSNTSVSGQGSVYRYNITNTYYYARSSQWIQYNFPLSFNLPISIVVSTDSVNVTFAYQILTNGQNSKAEDPINYDTAAIKAPGITNASIIINGWNNQTPAGYPYDAELVFGGEFNGERTTFTEMNATLNMYYLTSNGTIVTPYTLYGFGSQTGEAAYNLETMMAHGTYTVILGQPNFSESYISVPISFVPLNISSLNHTFGSANFFYINSNAIMNVSIIGGFAPFTYSLMDGNVLVDNVTTDNRTFSLSYSPPSTGDHILTVTVIDTAGNSVSSKPIVESYDYNYKNITLLVAIAIILLLLGVIGYLSSRKKTRTRTA